MNGNQAGTSLATFLSAGVAWAAGKGWIPGAAVADVTAAILAVGAAGYSIWTHRGEK